MKEEELRIGNWVEFPVIKGEIMTDGHTSIKQIQSIAKGITTLDADYMPVEDVQPIPLTEEWLVKFGFGKSDEHEMGHNEHPNFGFYYDYHFEIFRIYNEYVDNDIYLNHIQHVHQLQNLYFALTGEELKIKT